MNPNMLIGFIDFMLGGSAGIVIMSLFAVNSYNNGFEDGRGNFNK
jgi:hypothetical protein